MSKQTFTNLQEKGKYLWDLVRKNKKNIIHSNLSVSNKFLAIIEILNKNKEHMIKCHFEVLAISKRYPPQKNENKFVYGKLCEFALIKTFESIGIKCINLDDNHAIGSEYKNDLKMLNINISIKTKLNKSGDIIMINKKSTTQHIMQIETLLCIINEGKLYFIPSNIVSENYLKIDAGCISYKSSLITMINKNYQQFIYTFPELDVVQRKKIAEMIPHDFYKELYINIQNLQ